MDYTVHGNLQARMLKWVAFPFSKGSSQPRDWTQVSYIAGVFFTSEPTSLTYFALITEKADERCETVNINTETFSAPII